MILTDEPDMKVLIFCAAIVNSKREVHVVHTDVSRKRVHFIVNLRSVNSYQYGLIMAVGCHIQLGVDDDNNF